MLRLRKNDGYPSYKDIYTTYDNQDNKEISKLLNSNSNNIEKFEVDEYMLVVHMKDGMTLTIENNREGSFEVNVHGKLVINQYVDEYLKEYGFRESLLSPKFTHELSCFNKIIDVDSHCLIIVADDQVNPSDTMVIFVTQKEMYIEVFDDKNKFIRSNHMTIDGDVVVENIDALFDKLLDF